MHVLRGRGFLDSDSETSAPVAVIDDTLAHSFFPNEDPVGKRLHLGGMGSSSPWLTIVGVVAHVHYRALEAGWRIPRRATGRAVSRSSPKNCDPTPDKSLVNIPVESHFDKRTPSASRCTPRDHLAFGQAAVEVPLECQERRNVKWNLLTDGKIILCRELLLADRRIERVHCSRLSRI
jgi:MacB-like periplasmic core domain